MPVIKLQNFGGELPSVSARALPANAARTSRNLLAGSSEFRPLASDLATATSGVSNPKALYRLTRAIGGAINTNMATGWVTNVAEVNFVKGQIDDDLTERTYYTFGDGSAPGRVLDVNAVDRLMGVPAPSTKPAATHNAVEEYTAEEDAIARKEMPLAMFNAIKASLSGLAMGNAPPGSPSAGSAGWVPWWGATRPSPDLATGVGEWAFMIPMINSGGTYVLDTSFAGLSDYILAPEFGGKQVTWSAGQYWAIAMPMQGIGYTVNETTLTTELKAIKNPMDGVSQFIPDPNVAALVASIVADYAQTTTPQSNSIADLNAAQIALQVATSPANNASMLASGMTQAEIDSNRAAAVIKALANLKAAARRVTADYDAVNVRLADIVRSEKFFQEGVASALPLPTTRKVDTRFYVVTFVTDWGEESAPSAVSDLLTVDTNDTVTVARQTVPSGRGIVGWRLYRSNSGSQTASFQLVEDLDSATWAARQPTQPVYASSVKLTAGAFDYFYIAATGYTDSAASEKLQDELATIDWAEPPATLRGLAGMANGVMAGYFDNVVCFCEPYKPYAWPVKYRQTTKWPIMGQAAFGQSLFVGTRGSPYLFAGADSANMSATELPSNQSCVAARSIVATGNGAIYASPDGLCLVDNNGVRNITEGLFTREDWQALKPDSIVAALHDGAYYFLWNNGVTSGCYALDFSASKLVQVQISGSALFSDQITDTLYCVSGTAISALFATGRRTGLYRTGIINTSHHQPLAWLQVHSDFTASVTVRWYGDGVLRHTAVATNSSPARLPPGRYLEHEVEVETAARVTSVTLAGTTAELKAV